MNGKRPYIGKNRKEIKEKIVKKQSKKKNYGYFLIINTCLSLSLLIEIFINKKWNIDFFGRDFIFF